MLAAETVKVVHESAHVEGHEAEKSRDYRSMLTSMNRRDKTWQGEQRTSAHASAIQTVQVQ